jgi:antitoxin component YwqK of YwqJK toxin-antitoxin module
MQSLLTKIYEYDSTYHKIYKLIIKEFIPIYYYNTVHNLDLINDGIHKIYYNNIIKRVLVSKNKYKYVYEKNYYDNGNIKSESSWIDGIINDEFKIYHENGKLSCLCTYIDGTLQGSLYIYDNKGVIIRKNTYVNGKLHGFSYEYDSKGDIIKEMYYENAKIIEI